MKTIISFLLIFNSISYLCLAQVVKDESPDAEKQFEEKYQRLKDSISILYPFSATVSSLMLNEKQTELIFFNSLISANTQWDGDRRIFDLPTRQTYLYSTLQLTFGLSRKPRFNVGIDINSIVARMDQDRNSSVFKVFSDDVEINSRHSAQITSAAARVRWTPFKANSNFVIQNAVGFPVVSGSNNGQLIGSVPMSFLSQFLYSMPITPRLFAFPQLSVQYNFEKKIAPAQVYAPVSFYLSYLAVPKLLPFTFINYTPIFTKNNRWENSRDAMQLGGGLQYSISPRFLANAYYSNHVSGRSYQDFDVYSLSVRYITR